jgi:RHS repeat-associated protein
MRNGYESPHKISEFLDTPNREYNSAAEGRWLSPDPAGAGWNLYAYSTNPNSMIDPSGLEQCVGPVASCYHGSNNNPGQGFSGSTGSGVYVDSNGILSSAPAFGSVGADSGLPAGSVSVTAYNPDGSVISVTVWGTDGNVYMDTDLGIMPSSPPPPIAPSDAAWRLVSGTFNAPGAALNQAMCGGSPTCALFLGFALAVVGDEFEGVAETTADSGVLNEAEPVGSALQDDLFHSAATWMRDEAAENGTAFTLQGGDGSQNTLIQILGDLNGTAGRYEYIVNSAGDLTHQLFVPGGTINGVPIKP